LSEASDRNAAMLSLGGPLRHITRIALTPALVALAACGRGSEGAAASAAADDALRNDLALASAQQAYRPQGVVSPMEQTPYGVQPAMAYGYAVQPNGQPYPYAAAPAPVASAPARRTSSTASRSSGTRVVYAPAPAPRTRTVKHTKRDAAIGAAAGAAIGVATSRDKIKGGVIGAAAGGILGAVIGNNVDKKTIPF